MLGFWADREFVADIDKARGVLSRSQWIRNAVGHMLADRGEGLTELLPPERVGMPPPRAKSVSYGLGTSSAVIMNEHPGVSPERARELETMVARQAEADAAHLRSLRGARPSGAGAKRGAAKAKPST